MEAATEIEAVRFQVAGVALHERLAGIGQAHFESADDGLRDFVLDGEDVVELAVVAFGPDLRGAADLDELRGDADAVPGFAHAAFQDVVHGERLTDAANVLLPAFEGEGGAARRHPQARHAAESVQDLFGESIAEVLVVLVPA